MITVKTLTLTQNSDSMKPILKNISCKIPNGRITLFIGKSGAGKTSLLKCIAQLQTAYKGSIECNGINISTLSPQERVKQIGFVFQHFNLFPHMNALNNCINPLMHVAGLSQEEASNMAYEKLELLGMKEFAASYPNQLSGGQQQRIAIARALCLNPKFLLFDEPTSALDPENSKALQLIIKDLSKQGISIAIASHDMAFVKDLADSIYFLDNGSIQEVYDQKVTSLDDCPAIATYLQNR